MWSNIELLSLSELRRIVLLTGIISFIISKFFWASCFHKNRILNGFCSTAIHEKLIDLWWRAIRTRRKRIEMMSTSKCQICFFIICWKEKVLRSKGVGVLEYGMTIRCRCRLRGSFRFRSMICSSFLSELIEEKLWLQRHLPSSFFENKSGVINAIRSANSLVSCFFKKIIGFNIN